MASQTRSGVAASAAIQVYSHFVQFKEGVIMTMLGKRTLDLFDAFVVFVGPVAVDVELGEAGQVELDGTAELVENLSVEVTVLNLDSLERRVAAVGESTKDERTTLGFEETVGEVQGPKLRPLGKASGNGARTSEGCGVVLQIKNLKVGARGKTLADSLNTLHANTVLEHANLDKPAVCCVCLCPDGCGAVLETVASANYSTKLGFETFGLEILCGFIEGFCDNGTASDTETVVVELEYGEAVVVFEEVDHGFGGSTTKSIVGQVELYEASVICESIAKGSECVWNLGDESSCEDISKVGDL